MVVLDASALLAVLNREPGADVVKAHMRTAEASIINVCEVLTKVAEVGVDPAEAQAILQSFGFRTRAFRDAHAIEVAKLRRTTIHLGLSLGDRACLVPARFSGLPVLTSDTRMAQAEVGVEIRLIR
ncbi:type II toxin-antitoxin system VapC family toxin [Sphingomonas bacterium]|uniref:type II toxin-antitoxin system VapC family toxin n=1 Tax=Sphingomonas bacterium TaxID=1895847 RepID=UPI001577503A|nr:type II toxin-antitoxin system VapC family toxin [Sphingomonas bacterium]